MPPSTRKQHVGETTWIGSLQGRETLAKHSFLWSLSLLSLCGFIVLFASVFFWCRFTLGHSTVVLAALATVLVVCGTSRRRFPEYWQRAAALALSATLLICFISVDLADNYYDMSGDGRWYHQEGVYHLANGWNPFFDSPKLDLTPEDLPLTRQVEVWISAYPKGSWLIAGAIYLVTGSIESGKAIHLILTSAATLMAFSALLSLGISLMPALLLAFLTSWNTIVITQLFSYYLDGDLACALTLTIAAGLIYWKTRDHAAGFALVLSSVLAMNIKTLGVVYVVIIAAALVGAGLLSDRRFGLRLGALFLAAGTAAVCFVGYSPYVRNLMEHEHPFYPAMGAQRMLTDNPGPRDFPELNRMEDLFFTLFAAPEVFPVHTGTVRWKPLFRVTEEDLKNFRHWPDPAVNGYGVLFGEAVLLSAPLFILLLIRPPNSAVRLLLIGALVLILLSVVMKEFAWYARYNPQVWYVPILGAAVAFSERRRSLLHGLKRALAWGILATLAANAALVTDAYFAGQSEMAQGIDWHMDRIQEEAGAGPLYVSFRHLRSFRLHWEKLGIPYHEVRDPEDLPCAQPVLIELAHTSWCPGAE